MKQHSHPRAKAKTPLTPNVSPTQDTTDSIIPAKETPARLVGRRYLKERGIDYSPVHLLRLEADGKFPTRIYLSPQRVCWLESEVDAFITRCIATRG